MITAPLTHRLVHGAAELEPTAAGVLPHRLPRWARDQCPDPQLIMVEAQPSGVRIVADTDATVIELDVLATKRVLPGLPPRPDGVYDLVVDGQLRQQLSARPGATISVDLATGRSELTEGSVDTLRFDDLPAGPKRVELWLPHNETTELVALRSDHPLDPVDDQRPVWLHHGSSISHGSNAVSPSRIWPAVAAAAADVQLVNLGLGGSALLDPFTARTMRDRPADLISVKIGINLVNADLLRLRAFGPAVHGFLDTIRDGHPDTPLLVISPIWCPIHEQTPGPGAFDLEALAAGRVAFRATGDPAGVAAGRLTLEVIRAELARIVTERSATDPNLSYLDGLALYGPADEAAHPLPDALHPDAETHVLMGDRFAATGFLATS